MPVKRQDPIRRIPPAAMRRSARFIGKEWAGAAASPTGTGQRARIFISYRRNVVPDDQIALETFQTLSKEHDVFIDRTMPVGRRWAAQIETELRQADFLVVFLSAESIRSEMVEAEIETAHRLAKEGDGRPIILPVRLALQTPFPYPLSAYLNPLNWASWQSAADTPRLLQELRIAIQGGDLPLDEQAGARLLQASNSLALAGPPATAQPFLLEVPDGTMDPESPFYVVRTADQTAREIIQRQGVTITIKGPRQMGKSSLLMRTVHTAAKAGKRVAFLDFQLIDQSALTSPDIFFRQFCTWLSVELEQEDRIKAYWDTPLGNTQRCTRYVQHHLLKNLAGPMVLAMDEVEKMFDSTFRSDFFGMLRSWHNSRRTGSLWKQIDLVLVTSTEPHQFIVNRTQSPFNVGEVLEVTDFTPEQVAEVSRRHGSPLKTGEMQQLMELVMGHPYLVRRALYLAASKRTSVKSLFAEAVEDRGPFGDHLRYHLFRLQGKEELVQGSTKSSTRTPVMMSGSSLHLQGAGLVRREGSLVVARCKLYADFFRERLHV